jgi:uncharacterized protein YoxC
MIEAVDDPLKLRAITEMSLDEIEKHVEGMQQRRLVLVRKYEELRRAKDIAAQSATRDKMAKKLATLDKLLSKINADLEKASTTVNMLRGMRLELEDAEHDEGVRDKNDPARESST